MANNFLINTLTEIFLRPARNIGGISANVTIEEVGRDDLEITSHPVQQGADITDNAYKKAAELKIIALWADNIPPFYRPLGETYQALLALQASRIPFTVVTGKRIYNNMLFKSLVQTTDKNTENCLAITAEFKEIIIVNVEVTSVPPRPQQAQPETTGATENTGVKAAQPTVNNTQEDTALKSLFNMF